MEALTWFDWITDLAALVSMALGRRHSFAVPSEEQQVFWDLKAYGIRTGHPSWTWDPFEGEVFMFTVPKDQADRARDLMQSWGYV